MTAAVPRALLLAVLLFVAPVAHAQPAPLREADWHAVLAAEPHIEPADDCVPAPALARHGPCIRVPLAAPERPGDLSGQEEPVTAISGYAAIFDALYADLDGDGNEEAVIRVESGATAGTLGLLLFSGSPPAPLLLAAVPGYRMAVWLEGGALVTSQPLTFGFEASCCPTGLEATTWRLSGKALTPAATRLFTTGEGMREATLPELVVTAFYRALAQGRFEAAYWFLGEAYQAAHPFDTWREGYAATRSIAVETRPGPADDTVAVTITTVDEPGVTRRFAGIWWLARDPRGPGGYRLEIASIHEE